MKSGKSKMVRIDRRGVTAITVIVGVLAFTAASLSGFSILDRETTCRRSPTTIIKMRSLKNALETYNGQHGTYPPRLSVLYTMSPPLIEKIGGQDGWRRPFIYRYPNSGCDPARPFDLVSTGKSGVT
ncbi:MAG: type II secretion system protein GspG, partial [Phycisphaerales bacterium]